jgi:hypothetical protein
MVTTMFRTFVVPGVVVLSLSFPNAALAQTGCVPGAWTEVPGGGITTGTALAATVFFTVDLEEGGFGDFQLHLFATGRPDSIYTNVFSDSRNAWSGWSEVPGGFRAGGTGPAAVLFEGRLFLFALDGRNRIFVNVLEPVRQTWSGWSEVPGDGIGTHGLAAAVFADFTYQSVGFHELDLFVRGTDGEIWINRLHGLLPAVPWSGWSRVPGGRVTTHGPAAVPTTSARINISLFVRGTDGAAWENVRDSGTGDWRGWVSRGGFLTAGPGAASEEPGAILANPSPLFPGALLLGRGEAAGIWQNGSGQQWSEVPGGLNDTATAAPAVIPYPAEGAFLIFVSGHGDRVLCTASNG